MIDPAYLYIFGPPAAAAGFLGAMWVSSFRRTKALDAEIATHRSRQASGQAVRASGSFRGAGVITSGTPRELEGAVSAPVDTSSGAMRAIDTAIIGAPAVYVARTMGAGAFVLSGAAGAMAAASHSLRFRRAKSAGLKMPHTITVGRPSRSKPGA